MLRLVSSLLRVSGLIISLKTIAVKVMTNNTAMIAMTESYKSRNKTGLPREA
jgi:hypothetical protein